MPVVLTDPIYKKKILDGVSAFQNFSDVIVERMKHASENSKPIKTQQLCFGYGVIMITMRRAIEFMKSSATMTHMFYSAR